MTQSTKLNHWRELFSQYRECGMSVSEFCLRHGVRVHQFYYWRAKLSPGPAVKAPALIPVQLSAVEPSVQTHQFHVRLPNGVELSGLDAQQVCCECHHIAAPNCRSFFG